MCFSATTSFAAGTLLATVGTVSIKRAKQPSSYLFAGIPLLFAIQQFSEGLLWLSIDQEKWLAIKIVATYVFLFFAQVVWPFIVPIAFLMIAKTSKYKAIQQVLVMLGTLVSLYLAYCLFNYEVEGISSGHHIYYRQDYPTSPAKISGGLYLLVTILPPFFTGIKRMWILGAAIFVAYMVSYIAFFDYLVSVWCFFASIISIYIYYMMPSTDI